MVEIDPVVIYIFIILVLCACCPPIICKLRQVFCSTQKIYAEVPPTLSQLALSQAHLTLFAAGRHGDNRTGPIASALVGDALHSSYSPQLAR